MNQHLDKVDSDIAEKHLLKHPFYLAWTRGELSKEALTDYAKQYYHHVAAFPTYLSAVHAKCDDQPTRKQILSNLIDEEAGSPNHPELWKQFASGLGVEDVAEPASGGQPLQSERIDLAQTEQWPETKNLIDTFRSVCGEQSTAEGLAALYAYESQIPAICESKIDGLKKHYGFTDPKHYEYFSVHIEADTKHSADEREMLGSYVDDRNIDNVRTSVHRVLDALWQMLSGVCRRHAIAC
ncbi:MAG: pyrroloquinoline quinone biosynthesis protein PqqC [Verrucomicrobia bacterium]|nr:MAG: pyrroloquinoline quinone biosynthesis protein PqqC [Verrucomicrobiota bacterium]